MAGEPAKCIRVKRVATFDEFQIITCWYVPLEHAAELLPENIEALIADSAFKHCSDANHRLSDVFEALSTDYRVRKCFDKLSRDNPTMHKFSSIGIVLVGEFTLFCYGYTG